VGAGPELSYKKRTQQLLRSGIALWDVCAQGFRPGSLDSNISNPIPNDFAAFLRKHKHIKLIAFNGQPAAKLYRKYVLDNLPELLRHTPSAILPSTSPANASLSLEKKLKQWRKALCIIDINVAEKSILR